MRKTLKLGLNAFLICLILSSCSSCKNFNWVAKPWVGDSVSGSLINESGEVISCSQPTFDKMVCFDEVNMADLVAEIRRINNKAGKKASIEFSKVKRIKK